MKLANVLVKMMGPIRVQRAITHPSMRSQRAAIVEDEARIGPFLEARKVWRQQPKPSEYIPDTKDVHEIHRVAKVLDDPYEGLKAQRSYRASDNAFYSEDRGGDPVRHRALPARVWRIEFLLSQKAWSSIINPVTSDTRCDLLA